MIGLDYFGTRYFSAAQGRFASADAPFADQHPADPQSWNMYAYVRNNPLRFVDPDGLAHSDSRQIWVGDYHGEKNCATQTCLYWNVGSDQWESVDPRIQEILNSSGPDAPIENPYFLAAAKGTQMADPAVQLLGNGMRFGAGLAFPLTSLVVDLVVGEDPQRGAAQAAFSRKPGSLGEFKGAMP